ncbi:GNAT family N-acetyltransferase [Guptibacillus hwajinpoensis]|uniref:GNAT family N-acetyltransferase n=1 Tax=Guptibacillus hwajinpoensis TaxID=208199 RepID=UPI00384E7627
MIKANQIFVKSPRLTLRRFQMSDIPPFFSYRSHPEVAKYQSWENYQYEEAEAFVKNQLTQEPNQPGSWFQFAIALADTNQLIGDCALHTLLDEPRIVEVGFTISQDFQGKGYATEAVDALFSYIFETLEKHKVIAFSDVRNHKSIALLERLNMRREGHLLQNFMSKGQWVDEYQYAMLRAEWKKF